MIKKTLVSWYTLHTKCIVNSSTSVNKKRKQKTNLFYEYCYEFVDRLKILELKNFLYWFLFPETKIIFENYKTASFYHYYYWERFEPRSHVKNRLSLIVRVNVVLTGLLLLTVTDLSTTCAVVIFTVKVSSITSVDGIIQACNQGGCTGCVRTPPQAPKVRILILNIQVKECSRLNWSFKLNSDI